MVTGASTGIGYELARHCAGHGFDLVVAADEPQIAAAAERLRDSGVQVEPVETDLATLDGVDKLVAAIGSRPVEALLANAGRGLGKGFLDQDFAAVKRVVDTNIPVTLYLIQAADARRGSGPHSDHRVDRRFYARRLPGRLQRRQGVSRLVFVCAAP